MVVTVVPPRAGRAHRFDTIPSIPGDSKDEERMRRRVIAAAQVRRLP